MERPLFWRIFIWFLLSIKNKAILIANEATDLKLKSINMEVICKINFKKGVRSHQLRILNYGFGQKQITWIKWCISTTYFSVLFNGNPFGFFQSPKGLRKGNPISPYSFWRWRLSIRFWVELGKGVQFQDLRWVKWEESGWKCLIFCLSSCRWYPISLWHQSRVIETFELEVAN